MTIQAFMAHAADALASAEIKTARLDTLVLLSDELHRDKSWIIAHDDAKLTHEQYTKLNSQLARRAGREPLAYIRGIQDFYGHTFTVTPDVLIPRPETESLIEHLTQLPLGPQDLLVDVGTGSGAIAISAKLALSGLTVYGLDISPTALEVAHANAHALNADVTFTQGNLLSSLPQAQQAAVIIANLPYIDKRWDCSPETAHEPALALFADDAGLALIKRLIDQAEEKLASGGHLLLESDPRQQSAISSYALSRSYKVAVIDAYCIDLWRR